MKNKKIISLICALAMVFSLFSAFTVVNAENTKGIALAGSLSADGTEITIEATAVGTTGGLNNAGIAFNVPDGVTADDITYTAQAGVSFTKGVTDGVLTLAFLDVTGDGIVFENNKLATITIKLSSPLAADYVATLAAKAAIEDQEGAVKVSNGSMDATSITIAKWQDPNKKPDTVARPAKEDEPETPDVPTPVDPEGKGIALTASLDKTNTVLTVEATAVGTTGGLNNAGIAFNVPDGVTADDITYTAQAGVSFTKGVTDGVLTLAFLDVTGDGIVFENNKLATITIKLATPATSAFAVTLAAKAAIEDQEGAVKVSNGTMTATSAVAIPSTDEPTVVKTVALKDYVGTGYEAAIAAVPAESDVYLTVDVKKNDGSEATYGADFVAEYPSGTKLTEAAYNNLIHGYTEADMVDVINNLKFNIYSNDVAKIATTLNAVGEESQLVDPVEKTLAPAPATPTPKPADLTLVSDLTKLSIGGSAKLTATVNDVEGATPGEDVTFTITTGSDKVELMYAAADGSKTETLSEVANSTKREAIAYLRALKTGKAVVEAAYTYTDKDGSTKQITKTVSITVSATSDGGSTNTTGSTTTTGGNGPIASGDGSVGTGYAFFQDIADVQWAQEAIFALAMRNIISGRDEYTFDPNANITRAEYCQILVGAIGKTSESADSYFDDVASNAWYYHAVSVASSYGIVEGYGDGNFGPNDLITRQDMALMTYKAALAMSKNLSAQRTMSFVDADQISDYAKTAVQTLADATIINGVSDTEFAPQDNATRAQAAVILYTTFVK